jgi:predicted lipid-binding transport protein (Tim44 family)
MRKKVILFAVILVTTIGSLGCGGTAPSANKAAANANSDPLATTKPKTEEVTNNAPTLSPAVKAYCDAWAKNDEAALRKVYSSDTIKDFEQQMKDAKEKSLLKFLEDDKVAATPCEATNEQITGDNATVRIVLSIYPKGLKVVFVKENGEWKLTNKVPDIDSVTKSAANANTPSDKAK